jgi:hypothetical protein
MDARQVRWTVRELDRVKRAITRDWNWFERIDAAPEGAGGRTSQNIVEIEISSANPDAPRLIIEHYARTLDVPPEMIRVTSDGTGVRLMPEGRVRATVVTADGERPGPNTLIVRMTPDEAGRYGQCCLGWGIGRRGQVDLIATVGWWTAVAAWKDPTTFDPAVPVSEPVRVRVREDETVEITLVIEPGAPIRLRDR